MKKESTPISKKMSRRKMIGTSLKGVSAVSLPLMVSGKACRADSQIYDCIIIGSGFGATVAVSELLNAKPDLNVLVLERGVWWLSPDRDIPPYLEINKEPTQFFTKPDHGQGARYLLSILDTNLISLPVRSAEPLYKHHHFSHMDVLTASGVGGGSLIYLNVTIPPIEENGRYPIFKDWPVELTPSDYKSAIQWMTDNRGRLNKIVSEFPLSKDLIPHVDDLGALEYLYLSKTRAFRTASSLPQVQGRQWEQLSNWRPADLSIHEYNEQLREYNPPLPNGAHDLEVCTRAGRCFLGCPPGAIQTLDKTLLNKFLGKFQNLSLKSLHQVSHIEANPDNTYVVHGWKKKGNSRFSFRAKKIIVAAGTLGTNEILLRSDRLGTLKLSRQLGQRFSGNGDLGGFLKGVNTGYRVYPTHGPLITSLAQYKGKQRFGLSDIQMTVEDGGIPPTLAAITRAILDIVSPNSATYISSTDAQSSAIRDLIERSANGRLPDWGLFGGIPNPKDRGSYPTEHQRLENYFYFQCMGKDDPTGKFDLTNNDALDLTSVSGDPKNQPVYRMLREIMVEIGKNMGNAEFVRFPTPGLFTLHPLGGCSMGRDSTEGVVNTDGQLFRRSSQGGSSIDKYDGIYVTDASIFPGSVAVNPTLTIVAHALRICRKIRM